MDKAIVPSNTTQDTTTSSLLVPLSRTQREFIALNSVQEETQKVLDSYVPMSAIEADKANSIELIYAIADLERVQHAMSTYHLCLNEQKRMLEKSLRDIRVKQDMSWTLKHLYAKLKRLFVRK